jgi:hypothetical protein
VSAASRVERRPPAFFPVPGELEVVALAGHADDDAADPEPAAEELAEAGDDGRGPAGVSRQAQAVSMVKRRWRPLAEVVSSHSMIASARTSTDGGIVSRSRWAVRILMTRSNRTGCSTGSSPGFAPLRIL